MSAPKPLPAAGEMITHGRTGILRIAADDGVKDAFMFIVNKIQIFGTAFRSLVSIEPVTWNRLGAQVSHNPYEIVIPCRFGNLQMELEIWLNGVFA